MKIFAHHFIITLISLCSYSLAAQNGKIAGMPQELIVHEGQEFEVLMIVDPGSGPVSAVDLNLRYDPEMVTVLAIEPVNSPLNLNAIETKINHEEGWIIYNAFRLTEPWPILPFQLIRIRFLALAQTDRTVLYHELENNPKSLLAYAGKNTMESAPDVILTILPPPSIETENAHHVINEINYNCEKNGTDCIIAFSLQEVTPVRVTISHDKDELNEVLFDNIGQPGTNYQFRFDTSMLPSGSYTLQMNAGGAEYTRHFSLPK